MGLIDLKTNLRSLSYGSGRGEPYITRPVPAYDENPSNPYLGSDMFGRAGTFQRDLTDVARLTKYLEGGKGLLFNAKQIALEKTRPNVPYGPKRSFLFSTILAQAGVSGTGTHWDRTNSLEVDESEKYFRATRDQFRNYDSNRLGLLHRSKITKQNIPSNDFFVTSDRNDQTTLISYAGGPNSVGGIGKTTFIRSSENNTSKYKTGEGQYKNIFALTNTQLTSQGIDPSPGVRRQTGFSNIGNFIVNLDGLDTDEGKRVIGRRTLYSQFNRPTTYGMGDPWEDANLDRSTYYEGVPVKTKGVDDINFKSIYSSTAVKTQTNSAEDLIKFYIAVIDNNNPINKTYIHFRAYINGLSDNYSADWNSIRYPGRGEEFFKYGGFSRDIGFSFQVHVGSRAELFPVYNKLNYLASVMAPDYSSPGFMRGNIVQLTVGDYINDMYGVITNFNYNIPDDSPWDIARKDDGTTDPNSAELPMLINVDGFSFKPIHNFVPRVVKDFENPESKFISLGDKGYKNS